MRRWMAVSVLVSSTVIAFACSQQQQQAADSDAGVENGGDASTDVAPIPTATTTSSSPSIACPASVDETSLPQWLAPKSGTAGACSEAQISTIASEVSSEALSDIYDSLNPKDGGFNGCQACVFGFETDPNWQVIVFSDEQMDSAFLNYGACYALATGGTGACAKAVETEKLCQISACPDGSCTNVEECFATADESVCGAESDQTETACGVSLNTLTAACDNLTDVLHVVCGGANADAGADASSD